MARAFSHIVQSSGSALPHAPPVGFAFPPVPMGGRGKWVGSERRLVVSAATKSQVFTKLSYF